MILQTPIEINPIDNKISYKSILMFMGSCFASDIGGIMQNLDFKVTVNPFGVLYNPASIASSIERMESGRPFSHEDVIISDNLYTSFFHHSSFSRPTEEEFLQNANESLEKSRKAFCQADTCIITLGTAWVYRHIARNVIVSNCHKIPAAEFKRERLDVEQVTDILSSIVERYPLKNWIFTVSPIRHLKDGAHGNQISKATLLLAIDNLTAGYGNVHYFPAYEIMMDELRDYRFYCDNMTHPTQQAINYIFEKFCEFAVDPAEKEAIRQAEKRYKASAHIPMKNKKG